MVSRGAERPGDVRLAPTGAKTESPPLVPRTKEDDAFVVQAADYVANAIYSYYEYDNGIYKDILIPKFNSTQHFPYEHFGKKQLTEK